MSDILVSLYELLDKAENGEIDPYDRLTGICGHIINEFDNEDAGFFVGFLFVSEHCTDWKFFSGSEVDPIGDHKKIVNMPYQDRNLWQGKHLKYRLHLIKHLIKKLENGEIYDTEKPYIPGCYGYDESGEYYDDEA